MNFLFLGLTPRKTMPPRRHQLHENELSWWLFVFLYYEFTIWSSLGHIKSVTNIIAYLSFVQQYFGIFLKCSFNYRCHGQMWVNNVFAAPPQSPIQCCVLQTAGFGDQYNILWPRYSRAYCHVLYIVLCFREGSNVACNSINMHNPYLIHITIHDVYMVYI